MSAQPPNQHPAPSGGGGFLSAHQAADAEKRSWMPWMVAGAVVVIGLVVLIVLGGHSRPAPPPGGATLAAADPYSASLPLSNPQMSEATSFSGAKVTYLDGVIANRGGKTVTGITVQVGFRNALGEFTQRESMPLSLIRTREPYVDTQPVAAAPIKPGEQRDFRLIFDSVAPDWNQQFPEMRIISVRTR